MRPYCHGSRRKTKHGVTVPAGEYGDLKSECYINDYIAVPLHLKKITICQLGFNAPDEAGSLNKYLHIYVDYCEEGALAFFLTVYFSVVSRI